MTMEAATLDRFADVRNVLLTTYRRDGTPVRTPVSIVVDNGQAMIRTWDAAGKFKRIRNNPDVEIAPSTFRGRVTGPSVRARARVLSGAESQRARQLLGQKHPVLHGIFVPLLHRVLGQKTVHLKLTAIDDAPAAETAESGTLRTTAE